MKEHPRRPSRYPTGPLLASIEDLDDPTCRPESALRLTGARVVFADVELLQHDFPQLRWEALTTKFPALAPLAGAEREQAVRAIVDQWLIDHAAVVSASQALDNDVNTSIPTGAPLTAYRPFGYGRALVVPLAPGAFAEGGAGLFDVKGAGVEAGLRPLVAAHATGLMSLGEAIQDWLMQWIVEAIFRHAGAEFAALPLYAVLDAGFDLRLSTGLEPAGLQVRRAHRRSGDRSRSQMPHRGSVEEAVTAEIEMLLRCYGVTSSNRGTQVELSRENGLLRLTCADVPVEDSTQAQLDVVRKKLGLPDGWEGRCRLDSIDVQLVREVARHPSRAQLVDFGTYDVRERFEYALAFVLTAGRLGGVLHTHDPHFIQPIPELSVPGGKLYGSDLARRLRARQLTEASVLETAMSVLGALAAKWRA